uniref:DNA-directed RNA polymerase n=1 Tax=Anisakis simplex TaxID=6269 RepID=A0A0M3JNJ0_ANISI
LVAKDEDEEDDLCFDENGVCILEMEPWLAFKGRYRDMQAILKLRFKLMSYFLEVMKNPGRSESAEDTVSNLALFEMSLYRFYGIDYFLLFDQVRMRKSSTSG